MALLPGTRIRNNGITGNITDNPLSIGAVLLNSVNLAKLGVVSGDHAIITLDPLRQFGEPEIVMVTAHTATSTTATIQRAMYGTTARMHPQNTLWVHAATTDDFSLLSTSSTRPTDVWKGQQIFESDTLRPAYYNGTTWLPGSGVIVCTSATRPPNPFTGQHIYETDNLRPAYWTGSAWLPGSGVIVCTSVTRPASPFVGQHIYETDTKLDKVWGGTTWDDPISSDSGWIAVTLLNGWVVYGDGNYGTINMVRKKNGIVYIRGLLNSVAATANTAFTLPVGYRPAGVSRLFGLHADNGFNRYDASTDGSVTGPTGRGWVSFAGMTFPADQ